MGGEPILLHFIYSIISVVLYIWVKSESVRKWMPYHFFNSPYLNLTRWLYAGCYSSGSRQMNWKEMRFLPLSLEICLRRGFPFSSPSSQMHNMCWLIRGRTSLSTLLVLARHRQLDPSLFPPSLGKSWSAKNGKEVEEIIPRKTICLKEKGSSFGFNFGLLLVALFPILHSTVLTDAGIVCKELNRRSTGPSIPRWYDEMRMMMVNKSDKGIWFYYRENGKRVKGWVYSQLIPNSTGESAREVGMYLDIGKLRTYVVVWK